MIRYKNKPYYRLNKALFVIVAVLAFSVFSTIPHQLLAQAETEAELRNRTQTLEEKIAANQERLQATAAEADTLRNRIAGIETEISIAGDKIALTESRIEELRLDVVEAEAELERQKGLLAVSLRALYKQGSVSTIELLAASESYTDFINEQEYLERLKTGIQASADKVAELKQQLIDQQTEQQDLLQEQERQRVVLNEKRTEQAELLADTEGKEENYLKVIKDLEEQRRQAAEELQAYLASLIQENLTSLGFVTAGTVIGLVGSTGFSTGPHLHFAITDGSSFFNPVQSSGTLSYGMTWPLPNSGWESITQSYGCVAPPDWYITKCNGGQNSFHGGLDIGGWYGDPVVAAADGDIIFRGWFGAYGNTVIVDHGNGLYTYYPHLLE